MTVPAMEVGGDFYDYFPVNAHEFAFFIGDVCGQGISDAVNARGERFGGARIVACLQDHETGSLNALQETIMQDVKTFRAGQEQQDDMTVLIVQV